ncbi:MAG: 4-hydroxybenzoate 3-monooxygenase [Pseudomonadota bacterium]
MRTRVAIVGGGPAGLLLGQALHLANIDNVIVERRSREHVLSRVRAGVLEHGLTELMRRLGVAARLDAEGLVHDGVVIAAAGQRLHLDLRGLAGGSVTIYGQTELTRDLYDARDGWGGLVHHEAEDVTIDGIDGRQPSLSFVAAGHRRVVACDFVVGCDGFHGICRRAMPAGVLQTFERRYPFGWLGVLTPTPPVHPELIYATHEDGFALCSMRRPQLSRYYVQCSLDDSVDDWPLERFWDTLRDRLPREVASALVTGPASEMSIAPLRSFVAEPMRHGRLFLAGDAAHIVPPTGAKGLNLAAADVGRLANAFAAWYLNGVDDGLSRYSDDALRRVWLVERFSWWLTNLLHRFPDQNDFGHRMQQAELDHLWRSTAAQTAFAENYVGLPF